MLVSSLQKDKHDRKWRNPFLAYSNMKGSTPLFGKPKRTDLPNDLTRSQKLRIEAGYRKIDDHLQTKDIEGAIRDMNSDPIRKSNGVPYQHYKEVEDAINGLEDEVDSLKKSLRNPNLSAAARKAIRDAIKEFENKIGEWNKIKGDHHE